MHFPDFFSGANQELVDVVRNLGANGVLRIGGNTSARTVWTTDENDVPADASQVQGPDTGQQAPPFRTITPRAIRNLRDFLDATGWSLIYGLNMGTGSAEAAVTEASAVVDTVGSKLLALQFCNEPDLFHKNGVRPQGYAFPQFSEEWRRFLAAVRARLPQAVFAGPDTAADDWLIPFARTFRTDIAFLTQHYYALGPPTDPSMTIERLLGPDEKLEKTFTVLDELKKETGLPFRMAETNSCWGGGKTGVSNTFASALWGVELMCKVGSAGGIGINFHGGGYGWYTPIAGSPGRGYEARPLYYGMLLFKAAGTGQTVEARFDDGPSDAISAFAVRGRGELSVILINKSDQRIPVAVVPQMAVISCSATYLMAPTLDDTDHTTLGGARAGDHGEKTADAKPLTPFAPVDVPPYSAVLVKLR
ncbi:MAG: hypothetical protein KGJ78_00225 [Alphaproteobacteria bacterium]|nr:hypothetical protein [Alphaproteobacteria bacterium]